MKARTGLALSATLLAWLCFSAGAFAIGSPQPTTNLAYSAQTVALSSGGNSAQLASFALTYSTVNSVATIPAGNVIAWIAPSGNNWTILAGTECRSFPGFILGVLAVSPNTLTC